jgi:uncharacterized protein
MPRILSMPHLLRTMLFFRHSFRWGTAPTVLVFLCINLGYGQAINLDEIRAEAERGEAAAQFRLGGMHLLGEGAPLDYAKAADWLRKAAQQGYAPAELILGQMNIDGQGMPHNVTEAIKWIRKAAEQGLAAAQIQLGAMYSSGRNVALDQVEACKWFRKAAEQGDPEGQCRLGVSFEFGHGVPRDYSEAFKWFHSAAERGHARAQASLGSLFKSGLGVTQNYVEACKWYRRSAEQGLYNAQGQLAEMCATGQGVPVDAIEAYKWWNLASSQFTRDSSNPYAESRDRIANSMTPEQIAEAQRRSAAFVVRIESGPQDQGPSALATDLKATGSGFFITEDGYLLTNFHVVERAKRVVVNTKQGSLAASVVKVDAVNDVAALRVSGTFHPLPVGASRTAKLGDSVFTIGFPNTRVQGVEPKLTKGEISGLAGIQDDPRHFQISVAVQPGNSGGPLVNSFGDVIGIVTLRLDDIKTLQLTGSLPQNVNYAVKSSLVSAFLENLPEISSKLKRPHPPIERKFDGVVKEVEEATVLVLVY